MLILMRFFVSSLPLLLLGASTPMTHCSDHGRSLEHKKQMSSDWHPAVYKGLTMGRSIRAEMIRVFGEPKSSEVFAEDKSQSELWFHYDSGGEFPGELIFNVDQSTEIILRMVLHPKNLSRQDAIKHFGENYKATRYEFCGGFEEQESAPLYENPAGQFLYLEYRTRGIALAIGKNDDVDFIVYVSKPVASGCKERG